MKKVVLVDGNNLMFRSYYATAYSGAIMRNSKGFPTNALYGFINMINKIVEEEKPTFMVVAFDIGKNFRHEKYKDYKAGRNETPEDLKRQMPLARDILDAMGICHMEQVNYEADDIIGTLSKQALDDPEFIGTIVSSDRDLLQLINKEIDIKLLKQSSFIRYNEKNFYEEYGINPINVIDLKALAGDSSDNIPGVKGIGEKTALNLLHEYKTLEEIYNNIDSIKGKTQEKLIIDKENAFFSKELATICLDVPLKVNLIDTFIKEINIQKLHDIYDELEFYSFLKKMDIKTKKNTKRIIDVKKVEDILIENDCSFYIECDNEIYHKANILGMAISNYDTTYYIDPSLVNDALEYIKDKTKYTFDNKKNIVLTKKNILIESDIMIAAYLLNINVKNDDISYLINMSDDVIPFYDYLKKNKFENTKDIIIKKSEFIYDNNSSYIKDLQKDDMFSLYYDIELPLIEVLANMEITGVKVDKSVIDNMKEYYKKEIDKVSIEIFELSNSSFNISSPKQLSNILFNEMGIAYPNKRDKTYSTDNKILSKLINVHPIIEKIITYRNLTKINGTYLEGLESSIYDDGKVHTIYKQTLTRTGRLSSVEPNMQNIPVRDEEGKKIRKAFIPIYDEFISADYSQIELRVLAHISDSKELIEAFNNDEDIHTHVAADIFDKEESEVTKKERRTAKAVIFGIVYGISGFGLGENLEIKPSDAKKLIDKYLELYPGVKLYMDNIIKEAKEQGYVTTLYNRKRVIDELNSSVYNIRSAGERIALNTPIQGTAADILKIAMVNIYKRIKKEELNSKMVLQVHDELIFDVVKNEEKILKRIITEEMENASKLHVKLKIELDTGSDWYEAK